MSDFPLFSDIGPYSSKMNAGVVFMDTLVIVHKCIGIFKFGFQAMHGVFSYYKDERLPSDPLLVWPAPGLRAARSWAVALIGRDVEPDPMPQFEKAPEGEGLVVSPDGGGQYRPMVMNTQAEPDAAF